MVSHDSRIIDLLLVPKFPKIMKITLCETCASLI